MCHKFERLNRQKKHLFTFSFLEITLTSILNPTRPIRPATQGLPKFPAKGLVTKQ